MLTIWISFLPRFDLVWFGSVYVDDVDIIHTFMNILNQKTFENGWNESNANETSQKTTTTTTTTIPYNEKYGTKILK